MSHSNPKLAVAINTISQSSNCGVFIREARAKGTTKVQKSGRVTMKAITIGENDGSHADVSLPVPFIDDPLEKSTKG